MEFGTSVHPHHNQHERSLMQLFEYAVIKNEKLDKDGEVTDDASLIVEPTTILARDAKQAELKAARAIPDSEMDNLDRLTVVVRPF